MSEQIQSQVQIIETSLIVRQLVEKDESGIGPVKEILKLSSFRTSLRSEERLQFCGILSKSSCRSYRSGPSQIREKSAVLIEQSVHSCVLFAYLHIQHSKSNIIILLELCLCPTISLFQLRFDLHRLFIC